MQENMQLILQEVKELRCEVKELHQGIADLTLYNKPHFTFAEFCRFASISIHRGRALKKAGKLPTLTRPFGRKLYISREDAIAVLQRNPINSTTTIDQQAHHYLSTSKKAA